MTPPRDDADDTIDFFGDDPRPPKHAKSSDRAGKKKSEKAQARAEAKTAKRDRRSADREASAKRRSADKQARSRTSGSKHKNEKLANQFFGEEVIEAPSEGADVYRSASRRARAQRGLIKTTVFVVAPLSLAANVAILGAFMNQEEEEVSPVQTTSEHKPLAITAVEEYLAGDEDAEPMPGVELVSWDHAETTYDAAAVFEDSDLSEDDIAEELPQAVSYETHYLSLRSVAGTFFTATVEVAHSQAEGAWVTGEPSIVAEVPESEAGSGTGSSDEAFPGLEDMQATESMESAAVTWAEAYYSGSPSLLKQTLGDGRETTSYMPMPTADEVEVSVLSSVYAPGAEILDEDEELPDRALARIEVEATWPTFDPEGDEEHPMSGFSEAAELDAEGNIIDPDDTDPDDTGDTSEEAVEDSAGKDAEDATTEDESEMDEEPHVATVTYDVLIVDAHTATPRVVAWGAAGEGRGLNEFDNAVEGRDLQDGQE